MERSLSALFRGRVATSFVLSRLLTRRSLRCQEDRPLESVPLLTPASRRFVRSRQGRRPSPARLGEPLSSAGTRKKGKFARFGCPCWLDRCDDQLWQVVSRPASLLFFFPCPKNIALTLRRGSAYWVLPVHLLDEESLVSRVSSWPFTGPNAHEGKLPVSGPVCMNTAGCSRRGIVMLVCLAKGHSTPFGAESLAALFDKESERVGHRQRKGERRITLLLPRHLSALPS